MPKVLNVRDPEARKGLLKGTAVYVGRGGPFGNPFVIGRDGDRDTVIRLHKAWVVRQAWLMMAIRKELRGKDLVCHCAPEACHGDYLLKLAND